MLLKGDASQLEWRVKVFLAQDPVGMKEIELVQSGKLASFHDLNKEAFGLPNKTIAKVFLYRMIFADAFGDNGYSGPAFAYANDAEFQGTSKSVKYWENVVEKFFDKYKGVRKHSIDTIKEAVDKGFLTVPSGCHYPYAPRLRRGVLDWPRTEILNYPVQGFSAHLMQVARLLAYEELQELINAGIVPPELALFINTVHDDIEMDVDNHPNLCYTICCLLEDSFRGIPKGFEQRYGSKINVPMSGEIKFGMSLDDESMEKFNRATFFDDYEKYIENYEKQKNLSSGVLSKK